jgi:hypothetical protein
MVPAVMAGLGPAIHVFDAAGQSKTWMPGTNQDEPGHDETLGAVHAL